MSFRAQPVGAQPSAQPAGLLPPAPTTFEAVQALASTLGLCCALMDSGGTLLYVSEAAYRIAGAEPGTLEGRSAYTGPWGIRAPDGTVAGPLVSAAGRALLTGRTSTEMVSLEGAGAARWLAISASVFPERPGTTLLIITDVTESVSGAREGRIIDVRLQQAFEQARSALALVGLDRRYLRVNKAFAQLVGRSPTELVGSLSTDISVPGDRDVSAPYLRRLVERQSAQEVWHKDFVHGNGSVLPTRVTALAITDDSGATTAVLALYEPLEVAGATQSAAGVEGNTRRITLPRRGALLERISDWQRAKPGSPVHLLAVHLEGIREANAAHHHEIGDLLLHQVAERLGDLTPPGGMLAQLDLVVFALAWPAGTVPGRRLAHRVEEVLQVPVSTPAGMLSPDCRLGLTRSRPGQTPAGLLSDARLALAGAIESASTPLVEFDPALREAFDARRRHEQEVRDAIAAGRVLLYLQPIVALDTGRLVSMESLARLRTADGTLLTPHEFLPTAQRTGLIAPLGDRMLEHACAEMAAWRASGAVQGDVSVKVNVSPSQLLQPHAAERILATLRRYGVPAEVLGLEITESELLDLSERTLEQLDELAGAGVQVGIDDVGTGWSSLTNVRRLPLSFLKIDRTFAAGVYPPDEHPFDVAIVRSLLVLGEDTGLDVIMEGIETPQQRDALLALGARWGQGYLYARPMRPVRFARRFLRPVV